MKKIKSALTYFLAIIYGVLTLFPIVWILISSLKKNHEVLANPWKLPEVLMFENYIQAWTTAKMSIFFVNSTFYTLMSIILSITICSLAAYSISRLKIKFGRMFFLYLLSGIMIPMSSLIVPIYILILRMGLMDYRITLIIVYVTFTIPMTVALITANMKGIPLELEEAGVIDGCGPVTNFIRIIFPLCKPVIATVAILNFLTYWNEFIFAMMFTSSDSLRTLPVGLANFRGQYQTNYSAMAAGMVIVMIPTLIAFIVMQERVIKGVTAGAVKG